MRASRISRIAVIALLAMVTLASCAAESPVEPAGDPVGQWGEIVEGKPHLEINEDGTVLGNDGCNGIGGRWRSEDSTIHFDDMMMSLVMCAGMDTWLSSLHTAVVDGDTLHVIGDDGGTIGKLPRVR